MKIASWNLNSIRARQQRLLAWLACFQPEVLCLQELKCQDEDFPAQLLRAAGYHSVCFGQKTYNGVAILSQEEPTQVLRGLSDEVDDPQARLIAATVSGVRILCAYAPNGQAVHSPAYHYKLQWYRRLLRYLQARHSAEEKLVLCGDFNVAPEPQDVWDPKLWEGQTLFTPEERAALGALKAFGLEDTFRKCNPDASLYSWWDYRGLAFPKNHGLRIDQLYATSKLASQCTAAGIDREARKGKLASDHAPVWAQFQL